MATPRQILETIYLPAPCPVAWADMIGDDRIRLCSVCDQLVYDLSRMTRAEGAALVEEEGDSLCVQLCRRSDGTLVTIDDHGGLGESVSSESEHRRAGGRLGIL